MGCGSSRVYHSELHPEWNKQFSLLGLNNTLIDLLYKHFAKADTEGNESIDSLEILMFLDVDRTPFTERLFKIFDKDKSGEIDFREFVFAVYNYCTLDKVTLPYFAFSLYDSDGSGEIGEKEVVLMLKDIYGPGVELVADNGGSNKGKGHYKYTSGAGDASTFKTKASTQVQFEIPRLLGETIDLQEFLKFTKSHEIMLKPAFHMMRLMQSKIMGESYWEPLAEARRKFSGGKYLSIEQILQKRIPKSAQGKEPLEKKRRKIDTQPGKKPAH